MHVRRYHLAFRFALILTVCAVGPAAEKKAQEKKSGKADKEPPTQSLPPVEEPPVAVAADASKLTFHVSPLSAKGLLSQQTRDAIKFLMQANHGARMVKLRAFVAGTGDARRVQAIVSDAFAEKKQPLPVLSTIQAGALSMEGAQVVIESISEDKDRRPNSSGLAFFPAQPGTDAQNALDGLRKAAEEAGVGAGQMLSVTCFLESIDEAGIAQATAAHLFPVAAADFVQRFRGGSGSQTECEGVGRTSSSGPAKLVFSGSQMAFGEKDADLRLAFERLNKALEPLGASGKDVIWSNFYTLGRTAEEKLDGLRMEFFPAAVPVTALVFEGLPSPDASAAIEVVAAVRN